MKTFILVVSSLVFLWALSANAASIVLKAEHDEPAGSITDRLLKDMAKKVSQNTNGRVEMQVYPGCQLSGGKIKTMIQNTSLGSTHVAWVSAATFTAWDIDVGVCNLPFLVSNYDEYEKLRHTKPMRDLFKKWEKIGIKGVDYWSRALRQIVNTKRPILKPEDIKGLRIRVMETPLMVSIFKAMGAHPIGMPFGEIFSALQLGTIDGAERPTEFLITEKWWDLAKYVTMWDYTGDLLIVQANLKTFNSLEKKDQDEITKLIKEYGDLKYKEEKKMQEEAIEILKKRGMTVSFLEKEQQERFRKITRPVWDEYEPKFTKGLISEVVTALKK